MVEVVCGKINGLYIFGYGVGAAMATVSRAGEQARTAKSVIE
ncbi:MULTISPECIES: hypothetical protein [unclassified Symbiopectobacterium]|nr:MULTISPECIES: hypothetical protein [unclassified Symbiopectobacterium]